MHYLRTASSSGFLRKIGSLIIFSPFSVNLFYTFIQFPERLVSSLNYFLPNTVSFENDIIKTPLYTSFPSSEFPFSAWPTPAHPFLRVHQKRGFSLTLTLAPETDGYTFSSPHGVSVVQGSDLSNRLSSRWRGDKIIKHQESMQATPWVCWGRMGLQGERCAFKS